MSRGRRWVLAQAWEVSAVHVVPDTPGVRTPMVTEQKWRRKVAGKAGGEGGQGGGDGRQQVRKAAWQPGSRAGTQQRRAAAGEEAGGVGGPACMCASHHQTLPGAGNGRTARGGRRGREGDEGGPRWYTGYWACGWYWLKCARTGGGGGTALHLRAPRARRHGPRVRHGQAGGPWWRAQGLVAVGRPAARVWLGTRQRAASFYRTRRRVAGREPPAAARCRPCAASRGLAGLAFWQKRCRMPSMARQGALKWTAQTCAAGPGGGAGVWGGGAGPCTPRRGQLRAAACHATARDGAAG